MTMQTRGRFVGLVTATAETSAPEGALRLADNVVIRKEGVVEPRQGFVPRLLGYTPSTTRPFWAAHPYGTDTLFETDQGLVNTAGTTLALVRQRLDMRESVQARDNLYLPTSTGDERLRSRAARFGMRGCRCRESGFSARTLPIFHSAS